MRAIAVVLLVAAARHRGAGGRVACPGQMSRPAAGDDASSCSGSIRFNTVNPPGNEREAQEWLAGLLRDAGFEVELLGRTEPSGRTSSRACAARPTGPTLCLLSHVDTVLATPDGVAARPVVGRRRRRLRVGPRRAGHEVADRGRGRRRRSSLARDGLAPGARRPARRRASSTRRPAAREGAQWICEHHPDAVRCDYLLNEGGGAVIPYDGGRLLRRLRRREGRLPLHADAPTASPGTPRSRRSATTRC